MLTLQLQHINTAHIMKIDQCRIENYISMYYDGTWTKWAWSWLGRRGDEATIKHSHLTHYSYTSWCSIGATKKDHDWKEYILAPIRLQYSQHSGKEATNTNNGEVVEPGAEDVGNIATQIKEFMAQQIAFNSQLLQAVKEKPREDNQDINNQLKRNRKLPENVNGNYKLVCFICCWGVSGGRGDAYICGVCIMLAFNTNTSVSW